MGGAEPGWRRRAIRSTASEAATPRAAAMMMATMLSREPAERDALRGWHRRSGCTRPARARSADALPECEGEPPWVRGCRRTDGHRRRRPPSAARCRRRGQRRLLPAGPRPTSPPRPARGCGARRARHRDRAETARAPQRCWRRPEQVPGLRRLHALDGRGRGVVSPGLRRRVVHPGSMPRPPSDRRPGERREAQHCEDGGADAQNDARVAQSAQWPSSFCVRCHRMLLVSRVVADADGGEHGRPASFTATVTRSVLPETLTP